MPSSEFPWQVVVCPQIAEEVAGELYALVPSRPAPDAEATRNAGRRKRRPLPGEDIISLNQIEFCVLHFLASRPYYAFRKVQIIEAVRSWLEETIDEAELDAQVSSLRDKLGMFHDFVQTVPKIGYRFKE